MNTDNIAPCPNPECHHSCSVGDDPDNGFFVACDAEQSCGYQGPFAPGTDEAIRLHNALCAASGIPTEELEKLVELAEARKQLYAKASAALDRNAENDELDSIYAEIDAAHYAIAEHVEKNLEALRSLISRVREGKK